RRRFYVFKYFCCHFYIISLISVTFPVTAAAAAIKGLARNVRELGPCLPSKFRLEVEIQYFPAGILSSFIHRHALQPGSRNANPASMKILSRPSSLACCSTCLEPGTIHAVTLSALRFPLTKLATCLRSSIREFVQLPINT